MQNKVFRARSVAMAGLLLGGFASLALTALGTLPGVFPTLLIMLAGGGLGAIAGAGADKTVLREAFPLAFFVPFGAAVVWVGVSSLLPQSGIAITLGGAVFAGLGAYIVSRKP